MATPIRAGQDMAADDLTPVGICSVCGVNWLGNPGFECECIRPGVPPERAGNAQEASQP